MVFEDVRALELEKTIEPSRERSLRKLSTKIEYVRLHQKKLVLNSTFGGEIVLIKRLIAETIDMLQTIPDHVNFAHRRNRFSKLPKLTGNIVSDYTTKLTGIVLLLNKALSDAQSKSFTFTDIDDNLRYAEETTLQLLDLEEEIAVFEAQERTMFARAA